MKEVLVLGILWLAYVYVGYALLLALLGIWKRVRPLASESHLPRVSVLIAARNEAKDIAWKVAETLAWDYPSDKLEIFVASDASEDRTDQIVRDYADKGVILVRMKRRGGKVRALNKLAELACGEILFFTDANAHIGPNALRSMVRHFADGRVGCVTGDSKPIEEMDKPAISSGASVYWGYETTLKRLESRLGSVLVCDGAIFCIRASLFHKLDPNLANDLETPARIGIAGYWVVHEPQAVVFERDTTSPLEELRRRRRVCSQGMLAVMTLKGALRGLRGWQFISHKLLRWLSLVPMLAILLATSALARESLVMRALVILQGTFYVLAIVGALLAANDASVPRLLAIPFYVVLGAWGALVGVIKATTGTKFDVWEVAAESRGPGSMTIGNSDLSRSQ